MIKNIQITEEEKRKILFTHKLIMEQSTVKLSGTVYDEDSKTPLYGAKVILLLDDKINKGFTTLEDGKFEFDVDPKKYKIVVTNDVEGYSRQEEFIDLQTNTTKDFYLSKSGAKELQDVTVTQKILTIITFNFVNEENKFIKNVNFEIEGGFNYKNSTENGQFNLIVDLFDNDLSSLSVGKKMELEKTTNGYFYADGKPCDDFKKLNLIAYSENYKKVKVPFKFCLKNGSVSTTLSNNKTLIELNQNPARYQGFEKSNIFNIELTSPIINSQIILKDDEGNTLPETKVSIFADKEKNVKVNDFITNGNGIIDLSLNTNNFNLLNDENDTDRNVLIYVDIQKDGFEPKFEKRKLKYGSKNLENITLKKIVIPEPKPISFRDCRKLTISYYKNYNDVYNGKTTIESLGGSPKIIEDREQIKWCYINFKEKYDRRKNLKATFNRLQNVSKKYDIFELNFTFQQQRDIYKENKDMGLNTTIRKVISEKSNSITETKIIKNKLKFVLENSDDLNFKQNLLKECKSLIKNGYEKEIVKESYNEIINFMGE